MASEDGGSVYSKFASKLGSGAAKAGKRAAQSEAGRKAGRSAVKGAADAVNQDIQKRYSEDEPTSPSSVNPPKSDHPPPSSSSAAVTGSHTPDSSPDVSRREHQQYHQPQRQSHDHQTSHHRESRPEKPSFFSKLKRSKSPPRTRRIVTHKRDPKDRIYKSRLAKEANWDQLPMAQALYNYKAEMKCDLEFRKGQIIRVMLRTDTQFDWWEGKLDDRVGIFPANYVKVL